MKEEEEGVMGVRAPGVVPTRRRKRIILGKARRKEEAHKNLPP